MTVDMIGTNGVIANHNNIHTIFLFFFCRSFLFSFRERCFSLQLSRRDMSIVPARFTTQIRRIPNGFIIQKGRVSKHFRRKTRYTENKEAPLSSNSGRDISIVPARFTTSIRKIPNGFIIQKLSLIHISEPTRPY